MQRAAESADSLQSSVANRPQMSGTPGAAKAAPVVVPSSGPQAPRVAQADSPAGLEEAAESGNHEEILKVRVWLTCSSYPPACPGALVAWPKALLGLQLRVCVHRFTFMRIQTRTRRRLATCRRWRG